MQKIDDEKIIALLAEQTDQPSEDMLKQLKNVKERIRKVAKTGVPFAIENLGTFSIKDDTIRFEPDELLQAEINQQYAGMQPVEIMGASLERGPDIAVEENKPTGTAPREKKTVTPSGKSKSIGKKEQPAPPPKATPIAEEPNEAAAIAASASTKKTAEAEKPKASKKAPSRPKSTFGQHRSNNSATARAILATVAIIIILGAGWFLYDHGALRNLTGERQPSAMDSSLRHAPNQQLAVSPAKDSAAHSKAARNSTEQNAASGVSKRQADKPQTQTPAKYGLHGTLNQQTEGAFTIVIHSFHLKATVQQIADSLQGRGYRTVLFRSDHNTGSWWRLGLGQFKTAESAQDSSRILPEPYKNHHYIKRITR